jgi:hypothetical protein
MLRNVPNESWQGNLIDDRSKYEDNPKMDLREIGCEGRR